MEPMTPPEKWRAIQMLRTAAFIVGILAGIDLLVLLRISNQGAWFVFLRQFLLILFVVLCLLLCFYLLQLLFARSATFKKVPHSRVWSISWGTSASSQAEERLAEDLKRRHGEDADSPPDHDKLRP
ncbi:MAG: hypothetical protein ACJ795_17575 [Ktedonobacteraceae bacterium]